MQRKKGCLTSTCHSTPRLPDWQGPLGVYIDLAPPDRHGPPPGPVTTALSLVAARQCRACGSAPPPAHPRQVRRCVERGSSAFAAWSRNARVPPVRLYPIPRHIRAVIIGLLGISIESSSAEWQESTASQLECTQPCRQPVPMALDGWAFYGSDSGSVLRAPLHPPERTPA